MPRFNSPIVFERAGSTGYADFLWYYNTVGASTGQQNIMFEEISQGGASTGAKRLFNRLNRIAFETPDANGGDAFNYLNAAKPPNVGDSPTYLTIRLQSAAQSADYVDLDIPYSSVARDKRDSFNQFQFGQNAVVLTVDRRMNTDTPPGLRFQPTVTFSESLDTPGNPDIPFTGGPNISLLDGYGVFIRLQARTEELVLLRSWGQLVAQQGSIGLISIGSTGGLNSTEDITMDVRYNSAIVPGLVVLFEGQRYNLIRIELLERYRFMRLSLSRAS